SLARRPTMLDRTRAVAVVRMFRDELRWTLLPEHRMEPETGGGLAGAPAEACHINGVSGVGLWGAGEAGNALARLMEAALREVVLGTPDPGPYDVISRESPSGSPENLHFGAYGAAAVGATVTIKGS